MYNNLALFNYVSWSNIYLERNSVRHVQLNVSNILIMIMRGVSESACNRQAVNFVPWHINMIVYIPGCRGYLLRVSLHLSAWPVPVNEATGPNLSVKYSRAWRVWFPYPSNPLAREGSKMLATFSTLKTLPGG